MQKLIITFDRLSLPKFLTQSQRIENSLTSAPALTLFPDPWPITFPSRADLTAGFTAFENAYDAENGDKHAIAVRNGKRTDLTLILKRLAPYLESVAEAAGDPSMLETTGYDLRQPIVHGVPTESDTLPSPLLTVKRGTLSGVVVGRVKREPGATAWNGEYASGDPNVPANWKNGILSTKASQIIFPNLTPGTMYYFRVRAVGKDGYGAWSDVANLMAV
ncbi:MAG: fibronectin type III domain-containing protein [Verrucomicrobiota bacterium]